MESSDIETQEKSFYVEAPSNKSKKRLWMWIWIGIAVLAIAGIITAVVVVEKKKSSEKIKSNPPSIKQPSDNNIPTTSVSSSDVHSSILSSSASLSTLSSSTATATKSATSSSAISSIPTTTAASSTTISSARASFQTSSPECPNPRIRKEWRELSSSEQQNFLNAVKDLKKLPSQLGRLNRHEDFVMMHTKDQAIAHGRAMFFPWHRRFIQEYENALRQIDSSVTLPYWDAALDSQNPKASPIFADNAFSGDGDPSKDNCITSGTFAGWNSTYPGPHCLRRQFQMGTWPPTGVPSGYILADSDYNIFRDHIENNVHSFVHTGVGGNVGDMKTMISPNDPLFFIHHANIDRYYYIWQAEHPNSPYGGNENDLMNAFNVNVGSTKSTFSEFYCYKYSPGINPIPIRLTKRDSKSSKKMTMPDPPSCDFIDMMGGNCTLAMETYKDSIKFLQELIKMDDYDSPAVLYLDNRSLAPVNATLWRFGPSQPKQRQAILDAIAKSQQKA